MEKRILARLLSSMLGLLMLGILTSCGSGGSGSSSTGGGDIQVASGTIIGFGSVIVNGIEFSRKPGLPDDRVKLRFENNTSAGENNLRIGMTVNIRGTINNTTGKGEYESIEFQPDLRGPLDNGGTDTLANSLTVMGRKVQVSANTSFDSGISNLADISSALQPGEQPDLEISGNLDTSTGILNATRIARKALDFNTLPEKIVAIKGKIENASVVNGAGSFTIGTVSINFSAAALGSNTTIADISAGSVVEVKGAFSGTVITAGRIEKKNAVDAGVNEHVKLKGTANGGVINSTFTINGPNGAITINTAAASFQKGGAPATVAIVTPGITLEVEGVLRADGSVAASKVYLEVEKTVSIEGNAATGAFNSTTNTLTLNGVPVIISASTRLLDRSGLTLDPAKIVGGDHLQINGVFDSIGKVTASQVQLTSGGKVSFIQGPVTAVASPKLTLLGIITVDTSTVDQSTGFGDNRTGTAVKFQGRDTFFAALTSDGFTVVKAKGPVTGTTVNASEVELEQQQ